MFGGDVDPNLKFQPLKDRIVISTIQSFSRIMPQTYCDYFSCVMVDEGHRVSGFSGLYADVLQNLLAPYRFGWPSSLWAKVRKHPTRAALFAANPLQGRAGGLVVPEGSSKMADNGSGEPKSGVPSGFQVNFCARVVRPR